MVLNATDIDVFNFTHDMASSEFRLEEANIMDAWLIQIELFEPEFKVSPNQDYKLNCNEY